MRKIKNLTAKKLVVLIVGFLLLVATVSGILFGAKRNAYAQSSSDRIERSQSFLTGTGEEQKVTDAGPYETPAVVFDCKVFPDTTYFINNGYKYITVTLEFEMCEISDGYQIIFLCPGANEYRLTKVQLNYYGNRKIDAYHSVFVGFMSLPLKDFLDINYKMNIALRFDASGAGNDDWKYRKMNVRVEISKESLRTDNLKSDYS